MFPKSHTATRIPSDSRPALKIPWQVLWLGINGAPAASIIAVHPQLTTMGSCMILYNLSIYTYIYTVRMYIYYIYIVTCIMITIYINPNCPSVWDHWNMQWWTGDQGGADSLRSSICFSGAEASRVFLSCYKVSPQGAKKWLHCIGEGEGLVVHEGYSTDLWN